MTSFRYTGHTTNRAAIRAALGGSRDSRLGRYHEAKAQRVLASAQQLVPRDTGRLASTLRIERGRNQYGPYLHVVAGDRSTPYLGHVLFGTEPHVIRPRRAKALRFVVGGAVVFARRVFHPGTRARNFLKAALDAAR